MNGHGQSDRFVVPANPPNKAVAAEAGEERERTKGNAASKRVPDTEPGTARRVRWTACAKQHEGTRRHGSPRSCTMSTSIVCGRPTGR